MRLELGIRGGWLALFVRNAYLVPIGTVSEADDIGLSLPRKMRLLYVKIVQGSGRR